jgi:peptide-methionine (R)-S-oxide reductase
MKLKNINRILLILLPSLILLSACGNAQEVQQSSDMTYPKAKENSEWQEILTPFQYDVLREGATERPFTGEFYNTKDTGTYFCAACDEKLFVSDTKFDSGCGWPSFFEPTSKKSIVYLEDNSIGMQRTEVLCGGCGGHLGHVFNDGPPPTGLRYCINSASLRFKKPMENTK